MFHQIWLRWALIWNLIRKRIWIRIQKTTGSGPAYNECGSTVHIHKKRKKFLVNDDCLILLPVLSVPEPEPVGADYFGLIRSR